MSDNWDFYFCQVDDRPASIFVDLGLREEAPLAGLEEMVWLRLTMNSPREDGLSSREEFDRMRDIEDRMQAGCKSCNQPIVMVGRNTTGGFRDFFFYTAQGELAKSVLSQSLVPFPEYRFETGIRCDPGWEAYFDFLYPDARAMQDIQTRRVLQQLEQSGDLADRPRPVDHWLAFSRQENCYVFCEQIRQQGFSVVDQHRPDDDPDAFILHLQKVHPVDYSTIINIVLNLHDLAQSCDGSYDGWGSEVVRK